MATAISIHDNKSFSELEWKAGELFAVDNTDLEPPHQPFLLAIPDRIEAGLHKGGIELIFQTKERREEWTLFPRGKVLTLLSPLLRSSGFRAPNYSLRSAQDTAAYVVEYAYSGRRAILSALEESTQGLEYYAFQMKMGGLITERDLLGQALEKMHLDFLLPNQLRFASVYPFRYARE